MSLMSFFYNDKNFLSAKQCHMIKKLTICNPVPKIPSSLNPKRRVKNLNVSQQTFVHTGFFENVSRFDLRTEWRVGHVLSYTYQSHCV